MFSNFRKQKTIFDNYIRYDIVFIINVKFMLILDLFYNAVTEPGFLRLDEGTHNTSGEKLCWGAHFVCDTPS